VCVCVCVCVYQNKKALHPELIDTITRRIQGLD
jgi:hypothetical protein